MKKKTLIIIIAAIVASLLLGGAAAVIIYKVQEAERIEQAQMRAKQRKKRAEEKKKQQEEEALDNSTDTDTDVQESEPEPESEPLEEFPEYEDPLADNMDVVFLGDKGRDDLATKKLLHSLVYDKGVDPMSVKSVCASDFAGDGRTEAYVFAGELVTDDFMEYYSGDFWYVDEDEIDGFEPSFSEMWGDYGRFFDFGKRKYFSITERYTTGAPSDMWTVVDGKPFKDPISGYGNIDVFGGEGVVYHDTYDATFDIALGDYIGHTWKPYYFYYDENKDCLCEYESEYVPEESINSVCNYDILGDIKKAGGIFNTAYKRANGTVSINYAIKRESETEYHNATWNLDKNEYERAYDGSGATLEGSDFGGTYERYLTDLRMD